MAFKKFLVALGALASITVNVIAVPPKGSYPEPDLSLPPTPIKNCESLSVEGTGFWLVGRCGKATNALFLGSLIANEAGKLTWKNSGAFMNTCGDCSLEDTKLTCACEEKEIVPLHYPGSTIDLAEKISVYDGYLSAPGADDKPLVPYTSGQGYPTDRFDVQVISNCELNDPDQATHDITNYTENVSDTIFGNLNLTPDACIGLGQKGANAFEDEYVSYHTQFVAAGAPDAWDVHVWESPDCHGEPDIKAQSNLNACTKMPLSPREGDPERRKTIGSFKLFPRFPATW